MDALQLLVTGASLLRRKLKPGRMARAVCHLTLVKLAPRG